MKKPIRPTSNIAIMGDATDGYGRPLTDPTIAAIRMVVNGKGTKALPLDENDQPIEPEVTVDLADGISLGEDVPDNGFMQKHIALGYKLLDYRTRDKGEAKFEAIRLREEGGKALAVTLLKGRFGVFHMPKE